MTTAFQAIATDALEHARGGVKLGKVLQSGQDYMVKGAANLGAGGMIAGGMIGYPLGRVAQVPLAAVGGAAGVITGAPLGLVYGLGKGIYDTWGQ
jgi:hypothetical protein